jgi:peroxiredoxin/mono/diheme cytochrome c family protein
MLLFVSAAPLQAADKPKTVESFTLTDARTEKPVSLADFGQRKAVVVVFLGTACTVSNSQLIELARLNKEYSGKGVQFLGINANQQDKIADVAKHAAANELLFPVLKDTGAKVADLFGAQRTPEVFVLDQKRAIRYAGRVNDQFGIDYKKLQPTTRELADALDAVLAGKTVAIPQTAAAGCKIARAVRAKTEATVTFAKHIAPLLQKNCQECHRPGQAAPMSLLTYDDAASWAETIREAVSDQRMPPWYADPRYGKFVNDRFMTKADRDLLVKWVDEGCARGDERDLPSPVKFPHGEWGIGKPDTIISMEEEYSVPAETPRGGIPYQLFIVDPKFKEDRWVQRAEAKAGAPSVVHHVLAFIVPPRSRIDPDMPSPPFLLGVKNARILAGTAPGEMPSIFEPGMAVRIPAGSKIIFQMHYTPNGKAQKDRSSIGVIFAKEPPQREVMTLPVFNQRLRIPPGDSNHRVDSYFTMQEDGQLLTLMPHMHLRGKDFLYNIETPDGKETTILSVPKFNFNWQSTYRFKEPIKLAKGSKIHCIAHFDNSDKNPLNPDPTALVGWGDQTWQEMMIGWMDLVYERKPK